MLSFLFFFYCSRRAANLRFSLIRSFLASKVLWEFSTPSLLLTVRASRSFFWRFMFSRLVMSDCGFYNGGSRHCWLWRRPNGLPAIRSLDRSHVVSFVRMSVDRFCFRKPLCNAYSQPHQSSTDTQSCVVVDRPILSHGHVFLHLARLWAPKSLSSMTNRLPSRRHQPAISRHRYLIEGITSDSPPSTKALQHGPDFTQT